MRNQQAKLSSVAKEVGNNSHGSVGEAVRVVAILTVIACEPKTLCKTTSKESFLYEGGLSKTP